MIVVRLNQKGRVGKTTLALHLARELAAKGIGSPCSTRERLPRLFGVVGLARDVEHVVIDGPPRSALLAADLGRIAVQPLPLDERTIADMLRETLPREFPATSGEPT